MNTGRFSVTKFGGWKNVSAVFLLCAATTIASPAQTFNTLVNFDSTNGANPFAVTLVQGTDGNFYGTTFGGGAHNEGTVFQINSRGALTTLYSFCSQTNCTDGKSPGVGLVQATNGDFYGTAAKGGAHGAGTVFKITAKGTLTTVYDFCFNTGCVDGSVPEALLQATDGDFYGLTRSGGTGNQGTVFKITAGGALTTLHSFCYGGGGCLDGKTPNPGLIQATDGDFYGTTFHGGVGAYGTAFKITSDGTFTNLYTFCSQSSCTDGEWPFAGLMQAANGSFYGTTETGGPKGRGTVFKITSGGTLSILYSFCELAKCTDGEFPLSGLVQATDKNFYGTTSYGGSNKRGTIFELTSGGTLTTLHNFDGTDGELFLDTLLQATSGTFYGTSRAGGTTNNDGTVFSLSIGLGPFVATRPSSGKVGAKVSILGNNLTGATSVTFNGTNQPTFQVNKSGSAITTTVPTGATTGTVEVTTPKKLLKSNVVFRVTK
jgi:uncharacterized repeat protein (TIGR03803 family)